jgi:hypothetical protein
LFDVPLTWRALEAGGPPPAPSLRPAAAAALVACGAGGALLLEEIALCDPGSARGGPNAPSFALAVLRGDVSAALPADAAAADGPRHRWVTPAVQGAPPRPREHPAACAVGAAASLLFFGGWDGGAELADAFLLRRLPPDASAAAAAAASRHPNAEAPPPRFAWAGPLPATGGAPGPRSHATLTPMDDPSAAGGSASGGLVLLFGGYRADAGALNELWAARPSARLCAAATDEAEDAAGDERERGGGGYRSRSRSRSAASPPYDPWTDPVALTWHCPDAGGAPPAPRSGHAAAAAGDGCLYVHGGYDGSAELADLHRFDPTIAAWEALRPWGPAPGPRRLHAMAAAGRHLVLFGGWDGCV